MLGVLEHAPWPVDQSSVPASVNANSAAMDVVSPCVLLEFGAAARSAQISTDGGGLSSPTQISVPLSSGSSRRRTRRLQQLQEAGRCPSGCEAKLECLSYSTELGKWGGDCRMKEEAASGAAQATCLCDAATSVQVLVLEVWTELPPSPSPPTPSFPPLPPLEPPPLPPPPPFLWLPLLVILVVDVLWLSLQLCGGRESTPHRHLRLFMYWQQRAGLLREWNAYALASKAPQPHRRRRRPTSQSAVTPLTMLRLGKASPATKYRAFSHRPVRRERREWSCVGELTLCVGCGLAGGKWEEMEPVIARELAERGVPVTVYDLP